MNYNLLIDKILETSSTEFSKLKQSLDYDSFSSFVNELNKISGQIVVSGIGKSAIVANKFVATLNAVSITSCFLDSGNAVHGDIGVLKSGDALVIISKSGNTEDLIRIAEIAKRRGITIFLITNSEYGHLIKYSDQHVTIKSEAEFDDRNLIPSISVLLQMVITDAIVHALMQERDIKIEVFTANHPKGTIGKRHHLKVKNCVHLDNQIHVGPTELITKAITAVSKTRKGAVVVLENELIKGIITDGDIRRMLEQVTDVSQIKCSDIMNDSPVMISSDSLAFQALDLMNNNKISQLIVTEDDQYSGLIHLHDLL